VPHTPEVSTLALPGVRGDRDRTAVDVARELVATLGGRYSTELGIDVDRGEDEVERWFLAATLFGTRIAATIAGRTFLVLDRAGITRVTRVRDVPREKLVTLLDEGGYARYDFRTATRLQALSDALDRRHGGRVAAIGRSFPDYVGLRDALDALPGWGPVTVGLFLRELRGVWAGAQPPLDMRAVRAARHLGLSCGRRADETLAAIARTADAARLDLRDLESGLVRVSLAHRGCMDTCVGGRDCAVLVGRSREGTTCDDASCC
jgi:hypothetical protein